MSDGESRHEHLPTEGGEIFAENGSETVENDQTGFTFMGCGRKTAGTAQMQSAFAEQVAAQAKAHRAEIQKLGEGCHATKFLGENEREGRETQKF